jgi:predicted transcriptional regulator
MKDRVLNFLKSKPFGVNPTSIGLALGKDYNTASSSVMASLKKLKEEGLIERIKIDGKVLYKYKR